MMLLPALVHIGPVEAPPTAIIVGLLLRNLLHRNRSEPIDIFLFGQVIGIFCRLGYGAEYTNVTPDWNLVVEILLLDVVLFVFHNHHHGPEFQWRLLRKVVSLLRSGEPFAVAVQYL